MATFDAARPFRPWFLRVVANLARNHRRAQGRRTHLEVRVAAATTSTVGATPEDVAISDADRQQVVDALNRLDAEDRLVIALRWFEQMTEAEMAETMECPQGTVKSRLSRAMGRLRAVLEGEGVTRG
jgi:RNA polymerase sigma-70 factor, ECF subfamily